MRRADSRFEISYGEKHEIQYLILLVGLASTSLAGAAIHPTRCNSCTEAQYQTTAYNDAVAAHQATGYTYVYDMNFNHFRKYAVEREPAGNGTYTYTVYPVTPTVTESNNFATYRAEIVANGGSSTFFGISHNSDSGFPIHNVTSEDVVWTSSYRNQIASYLTTPGSDVALNAGALTLDAVFNLVAYIVLKNDAISVTTTVYMDDGGQLVFQWTVGQLVATLTSAMDADMNDIPLDKGHVPGQYIFNHNEGPNFVNYLNARWGSNIPVCVNGTLACTGDGNTNFSCAWVHCGGVP